MATSKTLSKSVLVGLAVLIALACFGTFRDIIYSQLTGTGFYWNESIVFQNFWIWLIPNFLIYSYLIQQNSIQKKNWFYLVLLAIGLTSAQLGLHVMTIMFYAKINAFPYRIVMVFGSAINEFALTGFLVNSFLMAYLLLFRKAKGPTQEIVRKLSIRSGTKHFELDVNKIKFLQKDESYVRVFAESKSYLVNETLRDLEEKLDGSKFVRIHKSCIVNRDFVRFTRSRKNGDYDLVLHNNIEVRLSRRFRAAFFD